MRVNVLECEFGIPIQLNFTPDRESGDLRETPLSEN